MPSRRSWEPLTSAEGAALAGRIAPDLYRYAQRFDEFKYPPAVYDAVRQVFRRPSDVQRADIECAIRWKFGHREKPHIPDSHARLICDIADAWGSPRVDSGDPPEDIYDKVVTLLRRPHAFITAAFLTHLVSDGAVPILDQHNLRAANYHLGQVRPSWQWRKSPRSYDDVLLVQEFLAKVGEGWGEPNQFVPSALMLDRYLMCKGQSLKRQRSRKIQ